MKQSHAASVTSLPQAPRDEASARVRNYGIAMGIRMLCFALTLLVTPYGWYTWVFAAATAVLPYIAVVFANAVRPAPTQDAESPVEQLASAGQGSVAGDDSAEVFTIHESPVQPRTPGLSGDGQK